MASVTEYFGSLSFDDSAMRARLPKDTYTSLKRTIDEGKSLDINVANIVANAIRIGQSSVAVPTTPTGSSPCPV